jgi:hypothetical protein
MVGNAGMYHRLPRPLPILTHSPEEDYFSRRQHNSASPYRLPIAPRSALYEV